MNYRQILQKITARGTLPVVAGIAAILLLATGLSFWIGRDTHPGIVPVPQAIADARSAALQRLRSQGAYAQSQAEVSQLALASRGKQDAYELLVGQAMSYENKDTSQIVQDDLKKALALYQQAAAISDSEYTSEAIGRVAEKLGDKQLAIDSYTKALQQLPASSLSEAQKSLLTSKLKSLAS